MILPRHSTKNPASPAGFFYTCNNLQFMGCTGNRQIAAYRI
jgi:hypothetical protein